MILSPSRFRLVVVALVAWTLIAWLRLAQVQVLQHERWHREATRQQERSVPVNQPRGDIRTRDGRLLAGSVQRVSVYAIPGQIPAARVQAVAESLSPLVGLSAEETRNRLAGRNAFFYLGRDFDPEIARAVIGLHVRGVGIHSNERRVYPHGPLAGPVVGWVNADGEGQAGIERAYQNTLAGSPAVYREFRDGRRMPTALELRQEKAGRQGMSLVLTLDSRIQQLVEEELLRTTVAVGAAGAAGVVMDPYTGEVLALVSLPAYDPGALGLVPPEWRRNRAVEDAVEPGSSFKPFILAAALSEGVLSPAELIDCTGGGIQVGNTFFRDNGRYGALPLHEMLAKSSNVGAIRIAHRLNPDVMEAALRRFGFGSRTGIEMPAEASGILRSQRHWSQLSRAGIALGQEVSTSALQMARAYAAIANGGRLITPTLVRETRSRSGEVAVPFRPQKGEQVLPPDAAALLRELLEFAVTKGTGKGAHLAGYRVAGKTGTAQRAMAGGYAGGHHAAWFAGFLPAHRPQVVLVLYIDQPSTAYWASEVAAPTAGRIAAGLLPMLGLLPIEGFTT